MVNLGFYLTRMETDNIKEETMLAQKGKNSPTTLSSGS